MNRIKQSIAVQRQIPEHIRENYPAFVEFVKVYYDFLEQTQAQNLEQIRDIDTTLDEFIDRFKSELAKNIPVELAGDKRLLLKHLREFYLSRGSEASFHFLFNALFNKDSTLFYPSTQILRASDGKWIQEISIFVQLDEGTDSLHIVGGKFVTINTGTKVLTTFVNAVNQYSNNIFEVYIEPQFASNIAIGSKVSVTVDGVTYSGTTLKCPSKVKIYRAGKGFKVGDLFNLKTQLGDGCLIKVTKIDTDGAIKAVQILRFGLAYETTFYSYLSSKNLEAIEYIHPIHTGPYVPGTPAYNERSGGFIDYGFAAKQTYMYYDENIVVGSNDRRSDRYFADASYVGDIETQFFAEDVVNPIDEDIAIIQVDLGAVARYPGYYSSADGFISDEIYIQDGNYYQAFSYVIRVEEELRKYADIVKALVHPSGMKMFAEYNIFKELKLSAVSTILSNKLQLPLDTNSPSSAYITDGGFNYDEYIANVVNQQIIYTPAPDAGKVFKNKAAYFMSKRHVDSSTVSHTKTVKAFTKNIKEDVNKLDLIVKHVFKPIADNINSNTDVLIKSYLKNLANSVTELSKPQKGYSKPLVDSISNSEDIIKAYDKNVFNGVENQDIVEKEFFSNKTDIVTNVVTISNFLQKLVLETTTIDDVKVSDFYKNLQEAIANDDVNVSHFYKNLQTSLNEILDSVEKYIEKPIFEVLTIEETSFIKEVQKSIENAIVVADSVSSQYNKNVFEEQVVLHTIEKDIESLKEDALNILMQYEYLMDKNVNDETSHVETHYNEAFKTITEAISHLEEKLYFFEKNISETVNAEELISKLVEKPIIDDPLMLNDVFTSLYSKYKEEELTILDIILITRLLLVEDFLNAQEQYSVAYEKMLIDSVDSISDNSVLNANKNLEEPINISIAGKLRDNPYDSGDPFGYFAYDEDYQPVTLLS